MPSLGYLRPWDADKGTTAYVAVSCNIQNVVIGCPGQRRGERLPSKEMCVCSRMFGQSHPLPGLYTDVSERQHYVAFKQHCLIVACCCFDGCVGCAVVPVLISCAPLCSPPVTYKYSLLFKLLFSQQTTCEDSLE